MKPITIQTLLTTCTRIVLLMAIFLVPSIAFSQTTKVGSIEYLKLCNGFKDIKLGGNIADIPQQQLTYMDGDNVPDADSCLSYVFYPNAKIMKADSDLQLQQIGLRVYKHKIVNIYLFFNTSDSYKILRNFLKDFGQFTDLPKEYANIYIWNTRKVSLSLEYQGEVETGVAIFTNNELLQDIESMKEHQKFMDSIASLPASTQEIKAIR